MSLTKCDRKLKKELLLNPDVSFFASFVGVICAVDGYSALFYLKTWSEGTTQTSR